MSNSYRRPFGHTKDGSAVEILTLDNGILSCEVITFGAALRSLYVPDRTGNKRDVLLGYDTLDEYETRPAYLGAVVGRVANRIAGGQFTMDGRTYTLAVNDPPNHLHGGNVGFSHRVWSVVEHTPTLAALALTSLDGEEGYPGTLQVRVTYALEGSALSMRYQATTDRETPCNLTGHAYFNLNGHNSGPVTEQLLRIHAEHYTPSDTTNIPTGEIVPVAGTPMDFRKSTPIGARIHEPFPQLIQANGYDHNYVIDGDVGALRKAAQACAPASGISMDVETTLPGLHFYAANFLGKGLRGKNGAVYGPRHAFCLETQFFLDAVNQPSFPSVILRPDCVYDHTTVFSFHCVNG
ncbi:aldose epimerase family protein [Pseudoflavonifractor phocaeensis]|uniref:aldose epimerase family protein n=1 Tax=Pseudoflavonifractor phocaeensis TaxID=1870988 RepID=UPI0025A33F1C|nr:aldose epimerase family protein [Pseudoflavonifractor phocaeensis]MDM8239338.1 aldose epimerase family protein [Pseudoflavonifractor phocaeensis]